MSANFDRRSTDPLLLRILDSQEITQKSLAEIRVSVAGLETSHLAVVHELLGNGQAGRIQRIEAGVEALKSTDQELWKAHSALKRKLVGYVGLLTGAVAVLKWLKH